MSLHFLLHSLGLQSAWLKHFNPTKKTIWIFSGETWKDSPNCEYEFNSRMLLHIIFVGKKILFGVYDAKGATRNIRNFVQTFIFTHNKYQWASFSCSGVEPQRRSLEMCNISEHQVQTSEHFTRIGMPWLVMRYILSQSYFPTLMLLLSCENQFGRHNQHHYQVNRYRGANKKNEIYCVAMYSCMRQFLCVCVFFAPVVFFRLVI